MALPRPLPKETITSPSGCTTVAVGTRVQFVGSGSGTTLPLTYSWNFGDGGTSTSQSPRHTFYTAGTYQVTLTVRDATGLADPTPATVTVDVGSTSSDDYQYTSCCKCGQLHRRDGEDAHRRSTRRAQQ